MNKRISIIILTLCVLSACANPGNRNYTPPDVAIERGYGTQNVQVGQGQTLPPYGLKVIAQVAVLELHISTSQQDASDRLKDIQESIDHITALASENELLTLEHISVSQVSGSYAREETSASHVQDLDASAVTLKLATTLAEQDYDLVKAIILFDAFLDAIELPETISVQALSVETELGDLESYRAQLISQVYRDLDSAQEEYGQSVQFEITSLYDPLKIMRLSDTEYYIYLEPVVVVTEF